MDEEQRRPAMKLLQEGRRASDISCELGAVGSRSGAAGSRNPGGGFARGLSCASLAPIDHTANNRGTVSDDAGGDQLGNSLGRVQHEAGSRNVVYELTA